MSAHEVPDDGEKIHSLADAAREFFSRPGPRLILATAAAHWARRAVAGPPTVGDAVAAGAVIVWWPLQEWLAHKHLLHWEPRPVAGRHVDPFFARKHREHHREPRIIANTLLPVRVVRDAIPASMAVFRLLVPAVRARRTANAMYSTMALAYEWTHFLVHTGYKPKSAFFKRVRRNHRLHHYRNENYWLGFTFPAVDTALGTDPDPSSVSASQTARDLYGLGT
jgi:hypothetical protein